MKLHLPKLLLTAVLAACVMANTASAEWDTSNTDTFYMDSTTVVEVSTVGRTPGSNGFFVRTNNNETYVNSSITTLTLGDTHRVNVDGSWDDGTKEFNVLTIGKVVAGGTGTINVALNNSVSVGEVEGTLNVQTAGNTTFNKAATLNDVTIYNGGVTFAGSEGTEYSLQNIHAENTQVSGQLFTDTITVNAGIKVTAGNVNNGWGLGSLTVNGEMVVTDTLKFGTGNNGNVGNVINGTGSITAGTFDIQNVTQAVLDVAKFNATNLVQGYTNEWGSSLTIKSGEVTFGASKFKNLSVEGGVVSLGATTVEGVLNISGGAVTLGEANLSTGSTVNVTGGSLVLAGDVTLASAIKLSGDAELDLGTGNVVTLSSLTGFTGTKVVGTSSLPNDQNGFSTIDTIYEIISGATDSNVKGSATFKLAGEEISVVDGCYTAVGGSSTTYVVNIGSVSTSSEAVSGAADFFVQAHEGQEAGTLVIDTEGNASALLTSTQGNGNIQLSTGGEVVMADGTATQATGKLIVSAGTTFKAGAGTTQTVDASSFTSVELAGGTVYAHNNGMTLNNLSTTQESTLHVQDMHAQNSVVRLSGTTVLNAELNVTSGYKGTLQIDKLTGTGNLDVNVGHNGYADALKVTINGIETYSGTISYEGDDQTNNAIAINNTSSGFSVGGFELTEGANASVNTGGDVTLGAGIIDNSTLTLRRTGGAYSVSYSSLAVSGTSTIQTAEGADNNNSWQAVVNIGALTGADATLKLRSGSNTTNATVFRLNGGQGSDFSGTIEIAGYNTGNNRKAVLSIGDATVAQNAEIKFNAESETSTVYLAIGAENVTVKGLSDVAGAAVIVSADVTQSAASVASDGTQRTLTLNTQGNDYTTAATLSSGLNIAKKGDGSQTFSGTTTDFSGSVSVEGGALAFAGTDALTVTDLTLAAGTKVAVGTGVAVAAEGAAPALAVTGAATLAGGSEVEGGLDLSSATSLTLNGMDSTVTITGDLTLPGTAISLSGDVLTALTGLTAGGKLDLFDVTGVFTLGDAAIASLTAEDNTLLNAVFSATEITEDYYLGYENGVVYAGKFDAVVPPTPVDPTVPEPTTATLSLLALAALAARRRRR